MRIAVLGATGHTGHHVLDLALGHGHHVTALVRSPDKLAPASGLTILQGNPLEPAALTAMLAGHDAVISVLGPGSRDALKPSTMVADYARGLIEAMDRAGVARLAIISAAVLFPLRGPVYAFFRWFLRHHARDLAAMEHQVQDSRLAWTIARPGRLVESSGDEHRAAVGAFPANGRTISFRAVAAFLVGAVERTSHVHEIVGLAR
jgi:putative NADH-flavin reductase